MYKINELHRNNILQALVLPDNIREQSGTYYFGKNNWFYKADNSSTKIINICSNGYSYCIHISDKRMAILVDTEEDADSFESENSEISTCPLYDEDEYFQISTIKDLRIPYDVISGLIQYYSELEKMIEIY